MRIKSIRQCKNLKNKTVLVRCDFDVPLNKSKVKSQKSKVLDDTRLKACVPTIKFLLSKKVKQIILIGHAGRPQGVDKKLSLEPVKKEMEKLIQSTVNNQQLTIKFINQFTDYACLPARQGLRITDYDKIIMLENLRFSDREQKNCKRFAKNLAKLADVYVNEAFAVSHRSESSIDAIQNYLPSYAGLHLEKEIKNLSFKKKEPLALIIGGAKIETKLPVIKNFVNKADYILIGGGVANTFLKVQGMDVKKSLVDDKYINEAKYILNNSKFKIQNSKLQLKIKNYNLFKNYKIKNLKIILPVDYKWSSNKIMDIGPQTAELFNEIIKSARTIIWNGPMGYIEDKKFAQGTQKILKAILSNKQAKVIIGGGETLTVINKQSTINNEKIFISTGGGAMLDFLAGKKLPGLKSLIKR